MLFRFWTYKWGLIGRGMSRKSHKQKPRAWESDETPSCLGFPGGRAVLLTVLSRDRSRKIPLSLHGTVSVLGFATERQARQYILAESSSTLFCLRTGRSLPAALHPSSRPRSCLQLRTDQCFCPIGTFTLLLMRTLRRTFLAPLGRRHLLLVEPSRLLGWYDTCRRNFASDG
jgi:hypothetical protein